jgi:hypothetical protein
MENIMTNWERGLLVGACVIGILAGVLFITKAVTADCVSIPFYGKACGVAVQTK